jgi:hypothetical protein
VNKARNGRHRRSPDPHADHRKQARYSRFARLLKQRHALRFAPTIDEGLTEGDVSLKLRRGSTRLLIMAGNPADIDGGRAVLAAGPRDQEGHS